MSVLGQASQEFDNIITVGAADGLDRADYSSYGDSLDILAPGGTTDYPILSTVGDGVGTLAGTSIATAYVTGAISQVWAANPDLSYRQVIDIVKLTATDLGTPNWDAETGAGLINLAAAIAQAQLTKPQPYAPEAFSTPTMWGSEGKVTPTERAVSAPIYPTIEPTSFTGRVFVKEANVRSGPGTSYSKVDTKYRNQHVQFDAWTYGEQVSDYALQTPDRRWYRIANTNYWIASAVIDGNAPGSTPLPSSNAGSSPSAWQLAIDNEYARINQKPVAFNGDILNIGDPISGYQDAYTSSYGTSGKWREYHVPGGNPRDGGAIYWSPQYGAVSMWYGFLEKYQQNGGSNGKLGFPVKGEYDYTYQGHAGRRMDFEGGWMFWSPATGDLVFLEEPSPAIPQPFYPVYQKYKTILGNPKSGGVQTHKSGAKFMLFDNGSIVTSKYGTFPLYGAIRQKYLSTSGLDGRLGVPTSAEIDRGNGTKIQYFEKGYIFWNGKTATVYYTANGNASQPKPLSLPILIRTGAPIDVKGLQQKIKALEKRVEDLQNALGKVKDSISRIEREANDKIKEAEELEKQWWNPFAWIRAATLREEVFNLTKDVPQLRQLVSALEKDLAKTRTDLEETRIELKKLEESIASEPTSYTALVEIPPNLNPGLSSPAAKVLTQIIGQPKNNKHLAYGIDVGPFKISGLKPALESLKQIFAKIKQEKPKLYSQLGNEGMLNIRYVKNTQIYSNHSWGAAIDIKINNQLDSTADGKAQLGLLELYPYFHEAGWYWGAVFKNKNIRDDSMHFEASEELLNNWKNQGLLN